MRYLVNYIYNTDYNGLNVRKSPSLSSPIVDRLEVATGVEVKDNVNNFVKIGDDKWVYKNYLSDKMYTYKVVSNRAKPYLNVRSGPSTQFGVIGYINPERRVQVYEMRDGWAKISPWNEEWVSASYLL